MRSAWHTLFATLALLATGAVAVLALREGPYVSEVSWLPPLVGEWADSHGRFRNFPAFGGLALVLIVVCGLRSGALIAAVLGAGLEGAQIFLPGRTFDWADIGWSLAGIAFAAGVVWLTLRMFRKSDEI